MPPFAGASGFTGGTGQTGATGVTGEWRLEPAVMWTLCTLYAIFVKGQAGKLHEQL